MLEEQAKRFLEVFHKIQAEIAKVIVGHKEVVEGTLIALMAKGNVLLEGVPGLGKTMLIQTLARVISAKFSRIQFTPDLMPADILGTQIVVEDEEGKKNFTFEKGPIFANFVLADEINRATPKTQSALLEAMQEHAVTVGGKRYCLDEPFFVLATQNPLEMEGTYPLPEAQLDRFIFKLNVSYPTLEQLQQISTQTTAAEMPIVEEVATAEDIVELQKIIRSVHVASHLEKYAAKIILATHPESEYAVGLVKKYVKYGSSPRGMQALILGAKVKALLDERFHVSAEDIRSVAYGALRHRLILNFEGEADGICPDTIIREILKKTPEEADKLSA
ncbi:MAG: MoxR family ATPase [Planctomycetota bacterium]|nr:MAG: MoxR family ATPase [Planctomycetota bacterium]